MRRLFLDTSESNFISLNSNNADCSWLLPDITSMLATHYSLELIDCSIPITQHAFISGRNTTFVFTENGGADLTFEIEEGTYSGTEIAEYLATEMTAAVGATLSYAGTFSTITKKITLYTTLPDEYAITADTTCLPELGFTSAAATSAVTHTSANVVNLLATRYLDIVVNFNTQSVAPNGKHNTLHRIPITEPVGGVCFFQNPHNKGMVTISAESARNIEIRLFDERGELYQISDNHRVTYSLLLIPMD